MNPSITLSELLNGLATPTMDCTVGGIQSRSAQVRPGDLFVACLGERVHGLQGLGEALQRGAAAVVYEPADEWDLTQAAVPCVEVPELSRQLSRIAGRFYREPSAQLPVIGITGTDGKTSTSHLIAQIMHGLGQECGVIGTLGAGTLDALQETGHTTPDAVRLQAELFALAQRKAAVAVLEVSSHALAQHRCDGVRFDTAVFTTLGRDHLDYHRTQQEYAAAKRRLFTELKPSRAVVNVDDAFGRGLADGFAPRSALTTCALDRSARSMARVTEQSPEGLAFEWILDEEICAVRAPGLFGRFNVMNLLLSATVVRMRGTPMGQVAEAMTRLAPVPGRLECVARAPGPVFIDYAHTPEALSAALEALRKHFGTDIHCVFGCGGKRDRGKRAQMGEVAGRLATHVTVTDDNPRGESPQRIVADILAGMPDTRHVQVEHDRAQAIEAALPHAQAGGVVLVAGKGHECEQVTATGARPFSDHATVCAALDGGHDDATS